MLNVYEIVDGLASGKRMLSLFNEHTSHSEYLCKHKIEREKFGGAVGRILSEIQNRSKDSLDVDVESRPHAHPLTRRFLSTRMCTGLERCIAGLGRNLPYSAEAMSLAIYYLDQLERKHEGAINCWTLDRLYASAFVVASKFAFDDVYPNTYYASRLGLSLLELNCLELTFLSLFDFAMFPDKQRWIRIHCMIARIAFEPSLEECEVRGSCPMLNLPSPRSAKSSSGGLVRYADASSASPSPVIPMISIQDHPPKQPSQLQSQIPLSSAIKVTVSLASPETTSNSPKPLKEVVAAFGKRHSQSDDFEKSTATRRHRRRRSQSTLGSSN